MEPAVVRTQLQTATKRQKHMREEKITSQDEKPEENLGVRLGLLYQLTLVKANSVVPWEFLNLLERQCPQWPKNLQAGPHRLLVLSHWGTKLLAHEFLADKPQLNHSREGDTICQSLLTKSSKMKTEIVFDFATWTTVKGTWSNFFSLCQWMLEYPTYSTSWT